MDETKKTYEMKPLEKMNVIDDFLFNEIMADEENGLEVCRMILSCVLKRKIGNIHYTPQKNVPGVSEDKHGETRCDRKKDKSKEGHRGKVYEKSANKKSSRN